MTNQELYNISVSNVLNQFIPNYFAKPHVIYIYITKSNYKNNVIFLYLTQILNSQLPYI